MLIIVKILVRIYNLVDAILTIKKLYKLGIEAKNLLDYCKVRHKSKG